MKHDKLHVAVLGGDAWNIFVLKNMGAHRYANEYNEVRETFFLVFPRNAPGHQAWINSACKMAYSACQQYL